MPTFEIAGITQLNEALSKISDVPEEVKKEILTEMGSTALEAIRESGRTAGIYDESSDGKHMLDSLALSKPKFTNNGGSINVVFRGNRNDSRHKPAARKTSPNKKEKQKNTRQAAVAFYNEYGTKTQRARPFVRPSIEKNRNRIFAAGERVYHRWLKTAF